ncbi:hypothetical protein HOV93_52230 [Planctomycetes bacterium FF15]|uniref:Uncharacterized protein n=1 Tax=Bremerella alba TaxID=980252 RepID=A0A7V8VAM8_9BACT|nr:hypothetical protein [Bremerella alba]
MHRGTTIDRRLFFSFRFFIGLGSSVGDGLSSWMPWINIHSGFRQASGPDVVACGKSLAAKFCVLFSGSHQHAGSFS